MKRYSKIQIFLIILMINNLVMLYFMGYFSSDPELIGTERESGMGTGVLLNTEIQGTPIQKTTAVESNAVSNEENTLSNQNIEIENAIQRYVMSEQFSELLDEYRDTVRSRNRDTEKLLSGMSVSELYEVTQNSSQRIEKQSALQKLLQGNINNLELHQLKSLYHDPDFDKYSKSRFLVKMIEHNDSEALDWAKQALTGNELGKYIEYDLLSSIYEKDPEFIRGYIDQLDVEDLGGAQNIFHLTQLEPELINGFFAKKFDQILESNNDDLYQMIGHNVDFDMTSEQQAKLVEFFESNNKHKRSFAINLAKNIDDLSVLREAYNQLPRKDEKQNFIYSLYNSQNNREHLSLVKELIGDSDVPRLQLLLRQIQMLNEK